MDGQTDKHTKAKKIVYKCMDAEIWKTGFQLRLHSLASPEHLYLDTPYR